MPAPTTARRSKDLIHFPHIPLHWTFWNYIIQSEHLFYFWYQLIFLCSSLSLSLSPYSFQFVSLVRSYLCSLPWYIFIYIEFFCVYFVFSQNYHGGIVVLIFFNFFSSFHNSCFFIDWSHSLIGIWDLKKSLPVLANFSLSLPGIQTCSGNYFNSLKRSKNVGNIL